MNNKNAMKSCVGLLVLSLGLPALAQTTPAPWPPQTEKEKVQWQTPTDTAPIGQGSGTVDPNFAQNIIFLPGHAKHCSNLLGGLLKCCREPTPDSQKDWWSIYAKNVRQGLAGELACLPGGTSGAAQMNGSANFSTLQNSLTSHGDNLNGGGQPVACSGGSTVHDTQMQFLADQNQNVKPNLAWYCNDEEFDLATMRNAGECHYVGTRCATSILGFCVVEKETYCCFNSPVSRIIREGIAYPGEFGTASNPSCGGISAARFQSMNLNNIDLNETEARMQAGGFPPKVDGHDMESEMTGGGSTIGNPGRENLTPRTLQRIGGIDVPGSQAAITANESITLPTQNVSQPTGAGQISFVGSEGAGKCNQSMIYQLGVERNGGVGTVSAVVQPASVYGISPFVPFPPTTLTWGNGDTSVKYIPITLVRTGYPYLGVNFTLTNPTGGAVILNSGWFTLDVYCQ
ncbi:MAG: conjugal transfer protein TraN [Sulfuricaulis sp.]